MTDCENVEVRELLPELLHGMLSARERATVERHLASCVACTSELELLGRVRTLMAQAPAVDVGRVSAALSAARRPASPPLVAITAASPRERLARSRVRPWQAIAAAMLLVVGLTAAGLTALRQTADSPVSSQTVVAPAGKATTETPPVAVVAVETTGDASALSLGGVLSALTDAELEEMITELDDLAALPATEPRPILLVEPMTDGEGAGS